MHISYDQEHGTLYWYMVELEIGDVTDEDECPVSLLCDANQQVVGIRLDLQEIAQVERVIALAQLHPEASWDEDAGLLTIAMAPFVQVLPLAEPAIIDLNQQGNMVGCDIADVDHETPGRYSPLQASMIDVDDPTEVTPPSHTCPPVTKPSRCPMWNGPVWSPSWGAPMWANRRCSTRWSAKKSPSPHPNRRPRAVPSVAF